jgi:DNA-binding NtrC family response regulator
MDSILVVEDEKIILELIAEILETRGYKVQAFLNADTAWESIKSREYPPRHLITDLRMPGEIDGAELVKRVHEIQPQTPILVASGYHSHSGLLNDPNVSWLPKPFDIEKLQTICQKLAPLP